MFIFDRKKWDFLSSVTCVSITVELESKGPRSCHSLVTINKFSVSDTINNDVGLDAVTYCIKLQLRPSQCEISVSRLVLLLGLLIIHFYTHIGKEETIVHTNLFCVPNTGSNIPTSHTVFIGYVLQTYLKTKHTHPAPPPSSLNPLPYLRRKYIMDFLFLLKTKNTKKTLIFVPYFTIQISLSKLLRMLYSMVSRKVIESVMDNARNLFRFAIPLPI